MTSGERLLSLEIGDRHLGIQAYHDPTDFTDKGIRQITFQDVRNGIQALQRRLQSNDQRAVDTSSDYCLTYRRNLAIQKLLVEEGNAACTTGSLSQIR